MLLFDTCILIDVINKHPEALAYFESLDQRPRISVLTVMEILQGAREKEMSSIRLLLEGAEQIAVSTEIAVNASSYLKQYSKSHSVEPVDALIVSTANVNELELVTLNRKHFPMFVDLKRPY